MSSAIELQMKVRQQAEKRAETLKDLLAFEKEMAEKDKATKAGKAKGKAKKMPPVRGSAGGASKPREPVKRAPVVQPPPEPAPRPVTTAPGDIGAIQSLLASGTGVGAAAGLATAAAASAGSQAATGSGAMSDRPKLEQAKGHKAAHTYDTGYKDWDSFDVDAALAEIDEDKVRGTDATIVGNRSTAAAEAPARTMIEEVDEEEEAREKAERAEKARMDAAGKGKDDEPPPKPTMRAANAVSRTSGAVPVARPPPKVASAGDADKEKGNKAFQAGKFDEAIEHYSRGLALDAKQPILYANRAMALLKLARYGEAEVDCTAAIAHDDKYVKAYLRRAAARKALGFFDDAIQDLDVVLVLEPKNRQAKAERAAALEEKQTVAAVPKGKKKMTITEVDSSKPTAAAAAAAAAAAPAEAAPVRKNRRKLAIREVETLAEAVAPAEATTPPKAVKKGKMAIEEVDTTEDAAAGKPVAKAAPAKVASPAAAPVVPKRAPKTMFEFERQWRSLRKDPARLAEYMQLASVADYAKMLREAPDADIIVSMVTAVAEHYASRDDAVRICELLAGADRFALSMMMIGRKEKAAVDAALTKLGVDAALKDKFAA